ncbi:KpsF/GutQ family sugar-phosphate isomerase [Bermanella marisrubri]|uniref:Arabinose 5-phosphate isomerase n=1 Tax=Bermanella marisrubri TaxID=207949 RepID=Q1MYN1_9GAMM|nr:KpsF/GutQ family sugar-phosphate isomerase [Bermanella marisrubri]EAT11085.1 KpsF/GutQ [Oceanobacter sp. RED65] [Bermanella marisrubri]QIZ83414.1 KpsF/GutQ family sugar-phosphate isomerase [Bermanella marisrubri]
MSFNYIESIQRTIADERDAVDQLLKNLNHEALNTACDLLLNCQGRIVVTGMGKSGHIGNKIAATLASTGSPAFFVHPGEAAHGDMGMITEQDVVIALSNSGESSEVTTLIPLLKRLNVPLISMTGNDTSTLATGADSHINVGVEKEACPLDLAPTSSTTVALVMGDALAIALLEARGFTAEQFAFSHPGGSLGRKLLLKVKTIMHCGSQIPQVKPDTLVKDALIEMTQKGLGMTTVIDEHGQLSGIFTDGDLRRTLDKDIDFHTTPVQAVMTTGVTTIDPERLAAEALQVMEEKKINALVATENGKVAGVINMHDLLRAGVI